MVALMEKISYESGEDLMNNNAESGDSLVQARVKEEQVEQAKQQNRIQAVINEGVATQNILAAQQASAAKFIIDPVSGAVIETEGSDGELSVASVISMLERGASDAEIEAALNEALATIAGKIGHDERKAKKYMAELLELLHVVELTMKQAGRDIQLQQGLRQMQEKLSKLMQEGNIKQMQEFLRSQQLREVLTKSIQQSRQQIDALRNIQQLTRNMAEQAKNANLSREAALRNLLEGTRNIATQLLRNSFEELRKNYNKLAEQKQNQPDQTAKEQIARLQAVLREQAARLKAATESARQGLQSNFARQAQEALRQVTESIRTAVESTVRNTIAAATLASVTQQVAANQQALDARMAADRVAQGNMNIAEQSGRQNNIQNVDALRSSFARQGEAARQAEQGQQAGNKLSPAEQLALNQKNSANDINAKDSASKDPNAKGIDQKEAQKSEQQAQKAAEKEAAKKAATEAKKEAEEAKKAEKAAAEKKAAKARKSIDSEDVKAEKADPCAVCGGEKGCCSSIGKGEDKAFETKVTQNDIDKVNRAHDNFRDTVKDQPITDEARQVEQGFGAPPVAPTVEEINAPPPPSQELG